MAVIDFWLMPEPYAEYVTANDLKEGQVYFYVTFTDDDGLVPRVEPVIFIGRDMQDGNDEKVCFQDAASFYAGVRVSMPPTLGIVDGDVEPIVYAFPINGGHVLDYEKALDVLLRCALMRRVATAVEELTE
jgi:hypothetical protein